MFLVFCLFYSQKTFADENLLNFVHNGEKYSDTFEPGQKIKGFITYDENKIDAKNNDISIIYKSPKWVCLNKENIFTTNNIFNKIESDNLISINYKNIISSYSVTSYFTGKWKSFFDFKDINKYFEYINEYNRDIFYNEIIIYDDLPAINPYGRAENINKTYYSLDNWQTWKEYKLDFVYGIDKYSPWYKKWVEESMKIDLWEWVYVDDIEETDCITDIKIVNPINKRPNIKYDGAFENDIYYTYNYTVPANFKGNTLEEKIYLEIENRNDKTKTTKEIKNTLKNLNQTEKVCKVWKINFSVKKNILENLWSAPIVPKIEKDLRILSDENSEIKTENKIEIKENQEKIETKIDLGNIFKEKYEKDKLKDFDYEKQRFDVGIVFSEKDKKEIEKKIDFEPVAPMWEEILQMPKVLPQTWPWELSIILFLSMISGFAFVKRKKY